MSNTSIIHSLAANTVASLQPAIYDDNSGRVINKETPEHKKSQIENLSQNAKGPAWGGFGPGLYTGVTEATNRLTAGVYTYFKSNSGLMLKHSPIDSDELLVSEDNPGFKLIKEIKEFWGLGGVFRKYGFMHRRGYLLSGPPGCGKTCLIKMAADACISQDAIILNCNQYNIDILPSVIKMTRSIEPERKLVCLFEDVDEYPESDLLSYLDGEDSISNVVNIATTNHIEDLPARLTARPRRFDRILKVGFPNSTVRRQYFKSKVPEITQDNLDAFVSASEEFSFAAMADLIVSVFCLNKSLNDAANSLKSLQAIQTF